MSRGAVRLRLPPEVHIVGADTDEVRRLMKPPQMRLIGGKRELLHAGGRAMIREIRVTKIGDEAEEQAAAHGAVASPASSVRCRYRPRPQR